MEIEVERNEEANEAKVMGAFGAERQIELIGSKTARVRTLVKRGSFFSLQDRATATEISMETEKILHGA